MPEEMITLRDMPEEMINDHLRILRKSWQYSGIVVDNCIHAKICVKIKILHN